MWELSTEQMFSRSQVLDINFLSFFSPLFTKKFWHPHSSYLRLKLHHLSSSKHHATASSLIPARPSGLITVNRLKTAVLHRSASFTCQSELKVKTLQGKSITTNRQKESTTLSRMLGGDGTGGTYHCFLWTLPLRAGLPLSKGLWEHRVSRPTPELMEQNTQDLVNKVSRRSVCALHFKCCSESIGCSWVSGICIHISLKQ